MGARFTLQGRVTCGRRSMTALSARGPGQWARAFTSGRSEIRKDSGHRESEGQALRPLPASLFLYEHGPQGGLQRGRAGADAAPSQRGHEILRSRLRPSPPGPHTSGPGPAPQVLRFARDDRQHSPCPLALEPKGRRRPGVRARRAAGLLTGGHPMAVQCGSPTEPAGALVGGVSALGWPHGSRHSGPRLCSPSWWAHRHVMGPSSLPRGQGQGTEVCPGTGSSTGRDGPQVPGFRQGRQRPRGEGPATREARRRAPFTSYFSCFHPTGIVGGSIRTTKNVQAARPGDQHPP